MKIVVANTVGRLSNGHAVVPFPSRWDCDTGRNHQFTYYPYELAYLSTLLKRECPESDVVMVDGNLYYHGAKSYAKFLIKWHKPDVIVTECSSLTFRDVTKACLACKKELGTRLILTGPHGTTNPEEAKAEGWDDVVAGEYEHKVLAILKETPTPLEPVDLDWLPWPEDIDICRLLYWEGSNPLPGMVQVYPTRGCPLSCAFCAVPLYYGGHGRSHNSHRTRDVDDVCDEIEYLADKYGELFKGCFFNEETHNANMKWLTSFASRLIDRGLNRYKYDAMCGYWPFTSESIQLLKEAGYVQLRMGVESTSKDVGKQIKKSPNIDKLEEVMGWCRQAGMLVYGTLQVGAMGSTKETDLDTLRRAREWRQQGLMQRWQCSISCPQPGTPFFQKAKDEGWLVTEDLAYYTGVHPIVSYPHYTAQEINAVHKGVAT